MKLVMARTRHAFIVFLFDVRTAATYVIANYYHYHLWQVPK